MQDSNTTLHYQNYLDSTYDLGYFTMTDST